MSARILGFLFIVAGAMHFLRPSMYEAIMPDYLPAHRELVYLSGVAEVAGGAAVLHPRTRWLGAWWLIATLVAVYPANVNMALNAEQYPDVPTAALWGRLPLQFPMIWWAYKVARSGRAARR